jgi:alpha-tubulin suppressor-like RCC1 family protein
MDDRKAAPKATSLVRLSLALSAIVVLLAAGASQASASSFGASAWGYNGSGQLGDGGTLKSTVPVAVENLSEVTAVAEGGEFSLALLANGTVMAWGYNHQGELGDGNTTNSSVPVAVTGLTGVKAIAAGRSHGLALLSDGTVMAWGGNEEGQLGDGKSVASDVPVAVKGISGVTSVAAGSEFSLALLSDGTVMAWGCNEEGQLGDGRTVKSSSPVAVKGISTATAVAGGEEFSLALLSDGTVMAWGSDVQGQLGTELAREAEFSDTPVAVNELSGVSAVAAGSEFSLALLSEGTVVAWGTNRQGELGNETMGGASSVPAPVSGLGGVQQIAAGGRDTLALLAGGSVAAWGYNADGQLGDGSVLSSDVPVAVHGLGGVAGVAAGSYTSLAFGVPLPSVTRLEPSAGPASGGTAVTITGTGFAEANAVYFGSLPATEFTVDSPTSVTAVAPAGAAGTVSVSVATPTGASGDSSGSQYTYQPLPNVTKLSAKKGPAAGGTVVTITGTGFAGANAVHFGAFAASEPTVNSATSITATSPPATSGTVDVTVTTPEGTSALSKHDHFKFENPTITSIEPGEGPSEGGTVVTIAGSGFAPGSAATTFKFAKLLATGVECASSLSCTAITPAGKSTVTVTARVGKTASKSASSGHFAYR